MVRDRLIHSMSLEVSEYYPSVVSYSALNIQYEPQAETTLLD